MPTVFNNPNGKPNTNRLVELMHPKRQAMVISSIKDENSTMKTYTLKASDDHELAYFTAGDYIPVFVEIDGNVIERPYAIASSPEQSVEGVYEISVKAMANGYVSQYIHENWKVGMEVQLGAPCPGENYQPLRDRQHVIALAGGVGVTPFRSIARAIIDGDVDCSLTLIYGANTYEEIVYKDEWKELEAASEGKFKVAFVIANEEADGCERGFISLDIINKYADIQESSLFISGPDGMVKHIQSMIEPLHLEKKYVRYGMGGDSGFNHSIREDAAVTITVHRAGETETVAANKNETVLAALERAGIRTAVHCRTGICGFCRSFVVKGEYSYAADVTGVRARDKELGFIHPCCAYPETDMEIVVQRD
ncbi:MAG: FAD-binding oxidoreductase [Eubacteriales bacterium]|nr:FAD-binding oxidoreductase [Eubacteriales bacterium]